MSTIADSHEELGGNHLVYLADTGSENAFPAGQLAKMRKNLLDRKGSQPASPLDAQPQRQLGRLGHLPKTPQRGHGKTGEKFGCPLRIDDRQRHGLFQVTGFSKSRVFPSHWGSWPRTGLTPRRPKRPRRSESSERRAGYAPAQQPVRVKATVVSGEDSVDSGIIPDRSAVRHGGWGNNGARHPVTCSRQALSAQPLVGRPVR